MEPPVEGFPSPFLLAQRWAGGFSCLFSNHSCFLSRLCCLEISSAERLTPFPLNSAVLKFLHGKNEARFLATMCPECPLSSS